MIAAILLGGALVLGGYAMFGIVVWGGVVAWGWMAPQRKWPGAGELAEVIVFSGAIVGIAVAVLEQVF